MESLDKCPECNGEGMVRYAYPSRLDPEAEAEWDHCRTCGGKEVVGENE